jgi:hypothetical protein
VLANAAGLACQHNSAIRVGKPAGINRFSVELYSSTEITPGPGCELRFQQIEHVSTSQTTHPHHHQEGSYK